MQGQQLQIKSGTLTLRLMHLFVVITDAAWERTRNEL